MAAVDTCRIHWYGNPTWFAVPLGANVWDVFGKGCFVVEHQSRRVIPIDEHGFTTEPFRKDVAYALYSKSGPKLLRECHNLRGSVSALRGELERVRQRSLRFERVTAEQLRAAAELLAAAVSRRQAGGLDDTHGIGDAMSQLRSLQRRIETTDLAGGGAGSDRFSASRTAQLPPAPGAPTADDGASAEPEDEEGGAEAEQPGGKAGLPGAVPVLPTCGPIAVSLAPKGGCARGKPDHPHQWGRTRSAAGPAGVGTVMTPIGHIRSCFAEKNGTPRQGSICPASRAILELRLPPTLNPAHAVDGLEHFSHVWLLWHFHQNGPAAIRSKVAPPRLDGERVGLFATRSPHRPNAIGLSAVRLERVDGWTLHLSGVDLIDGTPVFDVKPYVPIADSLALGEVSVPPWLRPDTAPVADLDVEMTESARAQLRELEPALAFFRSAAEAEGAIQQVLRADPRSVFWRHAHADEMYGFSIDQLNVVCHFRDGRAHVTSVQHLALSDRAHATLKSGDDR